MIPQEIVDFIYSGQAGAVGSRDENMVPMLAMCWGTSIRDTEGVVITYVVQEQYEQILKNFHNNGRVTVTLVETTSYRSYQFKGQFLEARAMTPDEVDFQRQFRETVVAGFNSGGYPYEVADRYVGRADLAIEFKVEEIFDQTPGPGAGKAVELAK